MTPGYKMTELGEIPEEWIVGKLGDYSTISMGQSPSSTSYNQTGEGMYLVQGNADIKFRKTNPRNWTTEITKQCKIGDIIMTVRAPVGAVAISKHNACIGRGVCAITTEDLDKRFLYQYLLFLETKWTALEQGSTFTAVNGRDIRSVAIPLPLFSEQQKIAETLSTVDEKIEVIEAKIVQTHELKKGLMQQLLTRGIGHTKFKTSELGEIPESWEVIKLGDHTSSFAGGTPLRSNAKYYLNGTIPWVKSGEVNQRNIICTEEKITELAIKKSSAKLIKPNSLLVALYGATAGNVGMLRIPASSNQAVLAINSNESRVTILYLYHYLKFTTHKLLSLTQGSGQPNLSKGLIDNLKVPIPTLDEQSKIANVLTGIDEKLEILQAKKENFTTLKRGLMQQLLTGKLRVTC